MITITTSIENKYVQRFVESVKSNNGRFLIISRGKFDTYFKVSFDDVKDAAIADANFDMMCKDIVEIFTPYWKKLLRKIKGRIL